MCPWVLWKVPINQIFHHNSVTRTVSRQHHSVRQYLQQLRDDGQLLWVTDVDGVVPVGFPLVADVAQVKDGRQQGEDPKQQVRKRSPHIKRYCGSVAAVSLSPWAPSFLWRFD